jgi:hypothetical protein
MPISGCTAFEFSTSLDGLFLQRHRPFQNSRLLHAVDYKCVNKQGSLPGLPRSARARSAQSFRIKTGRPTIPGHRQSSTKQRHQRSVSRPFRAQTSSRAHIWKLFGALHRFSPINMAPKPLSTSLQNRNRDSPERQAAALQIAIQVGIHNCDFIPSFLRVLPIGPASAP